MMLMTPSESNEILTSHLKIGNNCLNLILSFSPLEDEKASHCEIIYFNIVINNARLVKIFGME
jgi:hypothetical protein